MTINKIIEKFNIWLQSSEVIPKHSIDTLSSAIANIEAIALDTEVIDRPFVEIKSSKDFNKSYFENILNCKKIIKRDSFLGGELNEALRYFKDYIDSGAYFHKDELTRKEMVVQALVNLKGKGKLSEIYKKVQELYPQKGWKDQLVRNAINSHTFDSDYFEHIEDLFYAINGKGNGCWGLVSRCDPDELLRRRTNTLIANEVIRIKSSEKKPALTLVDWEYFEKKPKKQLKRENRKDYISEAITKKMNGALAEKIIVDFEKDKLIALNLETLANKVKHISEEVGDGTGYDILSFDKDGNELHIEVKSTQAQDILDFYISQNELEVLIADNFYIIYYICGLSTPSPKLHIVSRDKILNNELSLQPTQYRISYYVKER